MSGKAEKSESPGSKVLQKARSFKHDLKSRIKRTPSSSRTESKESSPSRKSSAQASRKKVGRTTSFNESSKSETKLLSEVERLDQEGLKVFSGIKYLRDVVTKDVLEQLSGATNIVLESVVEILQSIGKHFDSQDSTQLATISSGVHQCLANMIQWADHLMLVRKPMDKKCVEEYIDPLEQGIKDLIHLVKEKLNCRELGNGSKTVPRHSSHRKASSTDMRVPPIADAIPLTVDEIKILQHGNALKSGSHSDSEAHSPPPKPPLPDNFTLKADCLLQVDDDVFSDAKVSPEDSPPPLPIKTKSRTYSSYDNNDDDITPTNKTCLMTFPEYSVPLPIVSSGENSYKPELGKGIDSSVTMTASPRSQSPASSLSSVRSGSSVDFLFERSGLSLSQQESDLHHVHYDNRCQVAARVTESSVSELKSAESSLSQILLQHQTIQKHSSQTIQQSKQNSTSSLYSSSYDSGIYDNKNCGIYDNKVNLLLGDCSPPPLPDKKGKRPSNEASVALSPLLSRQRVPSMYDNMSEDTSKSEIKSKAIQVISSTNASSPTHRQFAQKMATSQAASKTHTINVSAGGRHFMTSSATVSHSVQMRYVKEKFTVDETGVDTGQLDSLDGEPPPLPPKKRHVETYMQIFGQSSGISPQELSRRSVRSMHFYQEQWQQHQMEVFLPNYRRSNTFTVETSGCLPARQISGVSIDTSRTSDVLSIVSGSSSDDGISMRGSVLTPLPGDEAADIPRPNFSRYITDLQRASDTSSSSGVSSRQSDPNMNTSSQSETTEYDVTKIVVDSPAKSSEKRKSAPMCSPTNTQQPLSVDVDKDGDSTYVEITENSILDEIDVSKYLVRKKTGDEGHDLRGGQLDALIVHATTNAKNDFMYQEAFLTTYRTMITSHDLVKKLVYRYNRFSRMNDTMKKKLSRNVYSLLTRVVNELCTEVDEKLIEILLSLVSQMFTDGELTLAKVLRNYVLEKCAYLHKLRASNKEPDPWPQYELSTKQFSMFHFKSQEIAEQMTLLDAELFQKIEIPEVLLWAKEQNEEHSPILTEFTEHFNKMSFWCRTRIMEQEDPKDREHCFIKFIKIMRYLEKFNNFNSYLAILSALSSSPLARLDWQKQNVETLAQYFLLIDNSHGFRTYRQRLSETEPPCIPYIGLILQDLTFVHVGNKDWLSDGVVNFVKRWQQFAILDNMRRFKKCNYGFTRRDKIIQFFNHFDNYLPEETLWQISESIKPPKRTLYK